MAVNHVVASSSLAAGALFRGTLMVSGLSVEQVQSVLTGMGVRIPLSELRNSKICFKVTIILYGKNMQYVP